MNMPTLSKIIFLSLLACTGTTEMAVEGARTTKKRSVRKKQKRRSPRKLTRKKAQKKRTKKVRAKKRKGRDPVRLRGKKSVRPTPPAGAPRTPTTPVPTAPRAPGVPTVTVPPAGVLVVAAPMTNLLVDDKTTLFNAAPEFRASERTLLLQNLPLIPVLSHLQLCTGIPTIGHYRAEEYNLRKRLLLFEQNIHDPGEHILNALFPDMHTRSRADKINRLRALGDRAQFFTLYHGTVIDPTADDPHHNYNLVYHPWVASWSGAEYSNPLVSMGIFDTDGVGAATQGSSIAINRLNGESVNTHPAEPGVAAMSPDNARFHIDNGREIATFTSVAMSPDRQRIIITRHILANSARAENFITQAIINTRTNNPGRPDTVLFPQFINEIRNLHGRQPLVNADDNRAIARIYTP